MAAAAGPVALRPPEAAEKQPGASQEDIAVETVEVVLDALEGLAMTFVMPLTAPLGVCSSFVAVAALAGLAEAMAMAGKEALVVDLLVRWMAWFELSKGPTAVVQKPIYSIAKRYHLVAVMQPT